MKIYYWRSFAILNVDQETEKGRKRQRNQRINADLYRFGVKKKISRK